MTDSGLDAQQGILRRGFATALTLSVAVNLLTLTGPLYMMHVYDRVLPARSQETLVALSLIAAGMFLFLFLFDAARGRILARLGAIWHVAQIDTGPVENFGKSIATVSDAEAIARALSSPVAAAALDLPWTPIFALMISVLHPILGVEAVLGGAVLLALATRGRRRSAVLQAAATDKIAMGRTLAYSLRTEGETLEALDMERHLTRRWQDAQRQGAETALGIADRVLVTQAGARVLRLALQSLLLGTGAALALHGDLSSGAMLAASVIFGRALAPVETVAANWPLALRAIEGWKRRPHRHPQAQMASAFVLPRPAALLSVRGLCLSFPGVPAPVVSDISFELGPGDAVGIIGPSGAGKSALLKAVCGVWRPSAGEVRLGGATPRQLRQGGQGGVLGYLPQRVQLFEGTLAENIARMHPQALMADVAEAAMGAGVHEMILRLPQGYETRVGPAGPPLSGGQVQRIGLARALYGRPDLLVLDEPEAALDGEGIVALNRSVLAQKKRGGLVLIAAHRPMALSHCERLLVLEGGRIRMQGTREAVLADLLRGLAGQANSPAQGDAA